MDSRFRSTDAGCADAFQARLLTALLCKLDDLCCCLQQRVGPAAGGGALPPAATAAPIAFRPAASPGFLPAMAAGRPGISRTSIVVPNGAMMLAAPADPGRTYLAFGALLTTSFLFDVDQTFDAGNVEYQISPATLRLEISRESHGGLVTAGWYVYQPGAGPATLWIWSAVG